MPRTVADDERCLPPLKMTLERAIEFIGDDELVEVTPESIRLRKAELDPNLRKRKSKVSMA
jgi:GTP-binding protein